MHATKRQVVTVLAHDRLAAGDFYRGGLHNPCCRPRANLPAATIEGLHEVGSSHAACSAVRHQQTFGRNHLNGRYEPDSYR